MHRCPYFRMAFVSVVLASLLSVQALAQDEQDKQAFYETVEGLHWTQGEDPPRRARRVGVVGWSGGGWMGALVAAHVPDLAFYVNIAGNASPGIEQAQHRFVARLYREGFSDEAVAEADRFLSFHHDVARGKVAWEDYVPERERVAETPWFQFLNSHFSMYYSVLIRARSPAARRRSSQPWWSGSF